MTDEQAYSQAQARWGPTAFCTKSALSPTRPDYIVCRVGRVVEGPEGQALKVRGIGETWEEAFSVADTYARLNPNHRFLGIPDRRL